MEAVPRLPMISFELKVSPEPSSFGPKLKQYIRDFYNEDPESYNNEIHQLESLRATAVRPPIDVTGCNLLKKYYCQVHFLQSRFPMGHDGAAAVTFTWKDTYANMVYSLANIRFEIISILYNVGAVHTQLGAQTERTTAEGMKMACAHFQCAAWAFDHLKNTYPQPPGVDLAPDLMTFMHQLCLGQAQECILEKSMLDNRKATIVAKVATQIVDYYNLALNTLEQGGNDDGSVADTVGNKIYKSWKRYVRFKKLYYLAVSQLYQGQSAEEQQKMGERVAFYNAALTTLNEARVLYTSTKGGGIMTTNEDKEAVEDALTFTNDVIEGKRKAAKNENEFIYHEEVPERDALPSIKGASLVRGIPFSVSDSEVSGPDIFARLVPMKVHEASSLYSEEKAKVLRLVGAKIEERDQQLVTYLASLRLENLSLWDPDNKDSNTLALPEELAERCAALNAKPTAIQDLVDAMGKLADTYHDVEAMLKDIDELLTHEKTRETEYQVVLGKRPPSIVATDLTREANKYQEAHAKASESNQALHRAMTLHVNNLRILAQPLADLMAHVPSPKTRSSGNEAVKKESDSIARELKRILGKVDEMRRQRSELHTQLRDSIAQDDLTRLLVTASTEPGSLDRLFAEQISKHNRLIGLIEQNLAAQDNILTALTDVYARSADSRKAVEEVLKRRDAMVNSLISSYDAYEDLLAKSSKGLEFYRKLETNVSKLLQRVKSTCKVQEEEREQILARNNKTSTKVVEFAASEEPTPTSGGLKLKDYLASRQKGTIPTAAAVAAPTYQNPYYGPQHAIQSGSPQPLPAVRPAPVGQEGSDATSAGVSDSADPTRGYQYPMAYTDYYTTQRGSSDFAHGYGHYTEYAVGGLNSSLPKSGTTNTSSTYRQANGATDTTEVTSFNGQYSNYEQSRYPQNDQNQYPSAAMQQLHYNPAAYTCYPGYSYSEQGYLPQNSVTPPQSGQPAHSIAENTDAAKGNPPGTLTLGDNHQNMVQAGLPLREDQQNPNQVSKTQPQLSQSQQIAGQLLQYETQNTQLQHSLQQMSQQNLQVPQTPAAQIPPHSHQSYATNQQVTSQYQAVMPSLQQPVSQSQSQPISSQSHNLPPLSHESAQSSIGIPTQYSQSQYSSSTYTNPYPPGVHQNQQGYSNSTSSQHQQIQSQLQSHHGQSGAQVQPSNIVQGQNTHVTQSYSNSQPSYEGYQNAYGATGYQTQTTQNSTIPQSYVADSYSNHSEMIQSHAKSYSTAQSCYPQNYPYSSLQGSQFPGQMQYQGYSQRYENTYNAPLQTDSYKGHPGYTYDPMTGGYQYSSGYQNSQIAQPEVNSIVETSSSSIFQQNQASSNYAPQDANTQYTIASNNNGTNHTPSSQYNQQSYQTPNYDQAYYTPPYSHQGQESSRSDTTNQNGRTQTYMQATNNVTNTTTSPSVEKKIMEIHSDKPKSNIDLLADLEFSINHAPLVPEVNPVSKPDGKNNSTDGEKVLKPLPKASDEVPTKLELEIETKSEEKMENLQIVWDTWYNDVQPKKDPLGDPQALQKFAYDVEKYEKFMDSLLTKTLSGATTLDIKWKEVRDFQEREEQKQSTLIALAHTAENRSLGSVPYDSSRVQLDVKDFYINASHVKDITPCIPVAFIIAQAPTADTVMNFWTMIWEQECEVVACLASNLQLNNEIYWPMAKGEDLIIGNFILSLESSIDHTTYVQRIISLKDTEKKTSRIVVHMQFTMWPVNGYPSSPGPLLSFSNDTLSEQALRRSRRPIVVHCVDGGTLSGLFLLAVASVCNVRAGRGLVDAGLVFSTLVRFRKSLVDQDSLLFAYRTILYHAQDTLMKRGILSSSRSTFECFDGNKSKKGRSKIQQRHPSDDFLHNLAAGMLRTSQDFVTGGSKGSLSDSLSSTTSIETREKSEEVKPVDPLSQLDPMWSIRK
ncbi:tyrosine-protein phosphatase non-receptor type 23 isoform X1 [Neodiprion fabricii]|uniref:tyrosine-protein phosphatase non-receptor type 23 isoform X1 n=1 Tax=Neodiprion fabricii TaxID=2872261 RepID=UPI001ED8D53E|nr:tyrosine-protein phosphatase non-receptor type 23 isoform X1 [Neodiprion fabricii]